MGYGKNHVNILNSRDGYNLLVGEYKKYRPWLDSFYRIDFNRFVCREKKVNIVDLGGGDGRLFSSLSKLNYDKYFVCDISEKMLEKYPGKVRKIVCDLENEFPFRSDFFDLSVSFFVIEHLLNLEFFFSENYRILKLGGKLIVGYFFQRREFLWKVNGKNFKIKMYKHRIDKIKNIAQNNFFDVYLNPVYDKNILSGYIILCEKNKKNFN